MQATLTSKGRITIPKPVRDALRLRTGDRVEFVLHADGSIRLLPVTCSVTALKGMSPKPARPVRGRDGERRFVSVQGGE